tara:strand:+ start:1164 stop:1700 length:537 start_codon:yes stop_codon:yes gene_type:complete
MEIQQKNEDIKTFLSIFVNTFRNRLLNSDYIDFTIKSMSVVLKHATFDVGLIGGKIDITLMYKLKQNHQLLLMTSVKTTKKPIEGLIDLYMNTFGNILYKREKDDFTLGSLTEAMKQTHDILGIKDKKKLEGLLNMKEIPHLPELLNNQEERKKSNMKEIEYIPEEGEVNKKRRIEEI